MYKDIDTDYIPVDRENSNMQTRKGKDLCEEEACNPAVQINSFHHGSKMTLDYFTEILCYWAKSLSPKV